MGGMQLQVNVVDQDVLRDAVAHPERHGDLIVRIGGYSEYFNGSGPTSRQAFCSASSTGSERAARRSQERLQLLHGQVPEAQENLAELFRGILLLFRQSGLELFLADDPAFHQ